jgi:predicted dehydrogenase
MSLYQDESKKTEADIQAIGVGMLGYSFMGKAHSNAYKKIPYIFWPPPAVPRLVAICGRTESKVAEAARRYGYARYFTDWKKLIRDPEVELFDNGAPNDLHAEACIEAIENGKHVLCEKPLAMSALEAKSMLDAAGRSNVKHMVGFNYRFIPAIQLAKKLISEDAIGRIHQFHADYLQDWAIDPSLPRVWQLTKDQAGSGALGDIGSHIVDLAHYLVGNISTVSTVSRTFVTKRALPDAPTKFGIVDVDDAFESVVEFEGGTIGRIGASRSCAGRKNYQCIEIYGENGSILFDLEKLNELKVHLRNQDNRDLNSSFHDILVTEQSHPYGENWWGPGHILGWEHAMIHEIHHLLSAIINDTNVAPLGATFEDGYKCNVVLDAMSESIRTGRKTQVSYAM